METIPFKNVSIIPICTTKVNGADRYFCILYVKLCAQKYMKKRTQVLVGVQWQMIAVYIIASSMNLHQTRSENCRTIKKGQRILSAAYFYYPFT